MKKKIFYWELYSAIIITFLGFIFHFAFYWFNEWRPLAVFFAVNESVWEHCKIGFWPAFFVSFAQYFFIGKDTNNFFIAKASQLFAIPITIITMFYTYTGAIGFNILIVDIAIFFAAILLGQYVSYKLLLLRPLSEYFSFFAIGLILIMVILFSSLTLSPGSIPLFVESNTGKIGIP